MKTFYTGQKQNHSQSSSRPEASSTAETSTDNTHQSATSAIGDSPCDIPIVISQFLSRLQQDQLDVLDDDTTLTEEEQYTGYGPQDRLSHLNGKKELDVYDAIFCLSEKESLGEEGKFYLQWSFSNNKIWEVVTKDDVKMLKRHQ